MTTANPAFLDVRVTHRLRGNTVVRWRLSPLFRPTAPVAFTIEWARTPAGDWHAADAALVFDSGAAVDSEQRLFGRTLDLFYRVRADAADGTYYSRPAQVGAWLDERGWLQAQELLRLAELNYDRSTDASPGCLVKKRVWGRRCPRCTDDATGRTLRESCPVCFGTGIAGGYYPPVDCRMLLHPRKRKFEWADSEHGAHLTGQRAGSCLAYPVPVDERDLWYNSRTGEVYVIAGASQEIEDSMKLGDFVIEQQFPLEAIVADDALYALLTGCGANDAYPDGCTPWTKPEPECAVPAPDVGPPGAAAALPDSLPRPEPPVPEPALPTGEVLQWL